MRQWLFLLLSSVILPAGRCAAVDATRAVSSDVDPAKVTAIEATAHRRGVQVYWLNYPRRNAAP